MLKDLSCIGDSLFDSLNEVDKFTLSDVVVLASSDVTFSSADSDVVVLAS
ncbi:TPA: hypothetical protein R1904_002419, partial [Staphylococcus delphini]|nr:hypothetical protein [Staphylococcus delphini]